MRADNAGKKAKSNWEQIIISKNLSSGGRLFPLFIPALYLLLYALLNTPLYPLLYVLP